MGTYSHLKKMNHPNFNFAAPFNGLLRATVSFLLILAAHLHLVSAIDCATITTCTPTAGFYTYKYGPSFVNSDGYENQVGDLYLPNNTNGSPIPTVVLIHGGYWYDQYRRSSTNGSDMRPLAIDLQSRGYAVVNLEYRRASDLYTNGVGRVPGTLNDIANGIDALSCQTELQTLCGFSESLDLQKVAVVGHSAGGHLALWSALRSAIGSNSYGIDTSPPAVQPIAAVGLAAVSDMNGCSDGTASGSAIRNLHGGVSSCAEVVPYNNYVSPRQMLTLLNPMTVDVAFYLSHGSSDTTVSPVQSTRFKTDADNLLFTTVEPSTFDTFSGEDHFDVIDPNSLSWKNGVIPFLDNTLTGCSSNEECDDGLACNGLELCDFGTLTCFTDPGTVCKLYVYVCIYF